MIKVSPAYKKAVYAPTRMVKGRVTFDISDTTIANDIITTTTTPEFVVSDKKQLTDKVRDNTYKLATWEPNRFKLDGSFTFADKVVKNNKNVGWVSDNLCNELGEFSPYEVLTFEFGFEHSSMGITITFAEDEYATDFTIVGYKDNIAVDSVDVVDNNDIQAVVTGQFYLYDKIEVIIKKWSEGYRRARVTEVDFGVVRVYTDDNLIKMDLIEEMDLTATTIPSGEFKFTVYNQNREFNILNPEGFYKFLQERQQVVPELGVMLDDNSVEYARLGKFYLMDWTSDEGSLTATFTARNIIDIMSSYNYENLSSKSNYSLYQMAIDILNICRVTNYEIDPALKNIITSGLVKKTNCRNVLQMIAIAGMCNVFVDRDSKLILKQNPLTPGDAVDTIDMDNMYQEPKIELDKIVKSVSVSYYIDLETSLVYTKQNNDVKEGDNLKVDNNTLINTVEQATNVANWILKQKKYRAKYTANWRGNPAHELNDIVIIEDAYNQNNKSVITKNELGYQGYLSSKTESRGLIT